MDQAPELGEAWLRGRLRHLPPARGASLDDRRAPPGSVPPTRRFASELVPPERQPAAVLVPIVLEPAPMVLLTRRSALLRTHSGQVSFPGGRPEPDDPSLADTALREAHEEIGLDPREVSLLGRMAPQDTWVSNYLITPFVGLLEPSARWRVASVEVDTVFGLGLEVLLDPQAPRRIEAGLRRGTWFWPHPEQDIWGATASILVRLARLLRGEAGE